MNLYHPLAFAMSVLAGVVMHLHVLALPLNAAPPNDAFANAIPLSGYSATVDAATRGATLEPGEFRWADNRGGCSIWYTWTAPENGICILSGSGPGYGLLFSVYVGNVLGIGPPGTGPRFLTIVAHNAYAGGAIPVSFDVVSGTTYRFSVDGYEGEQGDISFRLQLTPPNDKFSDAREIYGDHLETTGTTRGGTIETNEPHHGNLNGGRSVWWAWVAPASGMTTFRGSSTNMQPNLAVYTWQTLTNVSLDFTNLLLVAGGNEISGDESVAEFNAEAGARYFIALDGNSPEGTTFDLHMNMSLLRITAPRSGQVFPFPSTIEISTLPPSTMTNISSVELFANEQHLTTITQSPFTWTWRDVPGGSYNIVAHAVDVTGLTNSSLPTSILIYTNNVTPKPKIAGRFAINALGQINTWGIHHTGDFGVTDLETPLCADPLDPFCEDFGELLRTARIAKFPPGVTAWRDVASSAFALGNDGVLYNRGFIPINPVPPATTWNFINGEYMIDNLGRLYLLGLIRGEQGPYPWIEVSGALSMTTNRTLYHFDGTEFHLIPFPPGVTEWRAFSSGAFHYLAIGNSGGLYLGSQGFSTPALIDPPTGVTNWTAVAAGAFHFLAIGSDGQLYAWGRNWENQLGVGYTPNQVANYPTQVIRPPGVSRWVSIRAGAFQSFGLGDNCQLYSWGDNGTGELGVGMAPSTVYPQPVVGLGPLCGFPIVVAGSSSRLPDGNFRVEFQASLNQTYTIQYSSDGNTWISVLPSIVGAGEIVEWIDDGPPKSKSPPSTQPTRFYRVITGL